MTHWIRFERNGATAFGTLADGQIAVHEGDMFSEPRATDDAVPLDAVTVLIPCEPIKMIGLWNNLGAATEKNGWATPEEPLYFFKPPSCFLPHKGEIVRPASYDGRLFYEGELGVVIGRRRKDVSAADVDDCIFGHACVNDVTAFQLIDVDTSYAQWCRAKSFDTFGVFGPVIATGLDPHSLQVKTHVKGRTRQDYPVSDMFFSPQELVQRISRDMTLEAGDIITCGTSTGVLPMRSGATVEVEIDGIGTLSNTLAKPDG